MTTDEKVAEYLASIGVTYTATYAGVTTRENWECDAWRCKLANHEFEFYTGLGHRKEPKGWEANHLKDKYGNNHKQTTEWKKACKPVPPPAASLLYSLILDRSAGTQTFDSWCAEIGYDPDSRKALATYLGCLANTAKLELMFTPEQLAELETMLEDY